MLLHAGVALVLLMLASHSAEAAGARERVEVVELDIIGARAVEESALRALLETRRSSRLPWGDSADFDAGLFEADLKRIEAFYADRGYPRARAYGTITPRGSGRVALGIVVQEGEPVRVEEVVFTGLDVLPVEEVEAITADAPLQPGQPFARADAQETARRTIVALWNAGYAHARVEALEAILEPARVRIEIRAEAGLQAVFGRIDVTGNLTVPDAVIRRQLTYLPGQLFQVAPLEESRRRLERLGLFESVEIMVVQPASPSVETLIVVKERDHTEFTYSFGYGSEEEVYGEAGWRHLNFLGGARRLSTRGRWSWLDRGGEAQFLQLYLFDTRLTLALDAYVWQFDEAPFEALSAGGRAGVRADVGRSAFSLTYIQQHDRIELPAGALNDLVSQSQFARLGLDATSGLQTGMLAALEFRAARDTSIESGGVTRGSLVTVLVEQAGAWLPGAFTYVRVLGDARYYHGLGGATLAGRVQYGSIAGRDGPSDVPFSRRYFLGGAQTLRGWGRLEVGPLSAAGLPIGGQSLAAASAELRVPVIGPLGAVAFMDAGNVWEGAWTLSSRLHADSGLGVRYRSPFGLLRFDVAWQVTTFEGLRIDGDPRTRRWRLHAGAGHAF